MIIRVSELSPEGLDVRDARQFSTPAFTDPEWRLDGVDLHVQPDGDDVTVQGTIEATVPLACGR